jgi:hypothetical protein
MLPQRGRAEKGRERSIVRKSNRREKTRRKGREEGCLAGHELRSTTAI